MTTPGKETEKSVACDDDGIVSVVYSFAKKVLLKFDRSVIIFLCDGMNSRRPWSVSFTSPDI